jgi:RNA polymerase sigma-70 factor (ECF subfamily)
MLAVALEGDDGSPDRHSSDPSSFSDVRLLNDLKEQRPAALACLYDRYGSVVYGVALKVLRSPPEAEDLTQEIFLSLWQRPIDPEKQGHLLQYLVTMTRSRSIDKLRSRSRTLNLVQRWGQNVDTASPAHTPVEQAVFKERSQQVRQALTQLSDSQRQVIELAYDAGLSQSEIAQKLHQPLGTVKSWTRLSWRNMMGSVAALLILYLGVDNYRLRQDHRIAQDINGLLQQSQTQLFSLKAVNASDTAMGSFVVNLGQRQGILSVKNLAAPPTGNIYRLWAIADGEKIPCGTLKINPQGKVLDKFWMPADFYDTGISGLFVTLESSETGRYPTGAIVMQSHVATQI